MQSAKQSDIYKIKKNTIPEMFRTILELDAEIRKEYVDEKHKNQPYFIEETFIKIKKRYDWAMADIEARLKILVDQESKLTRSDEEIRSLSSLLDQSVGDFGMEKSSTDIGLSSTTNAPLNMSMTAPNNASNGAADTDQNEPDQNNQPISIMMLQYEELMQLIATARENINDQSRGQSATLLQMLNEQWNTFKAEFI